MRIAEKQCCMKYWVCCKIYNNAMPPMNSNTMLYLSTMRQGRGKEEALLLYKSRSMYMYTSGAAVRRHWVHPIIIVSNFSFPTCIGFLFFHPSLYHRYR